MALVGCVFFFLLLGVSQSGGLSLATRNTKSATVRAAADALMLKVYNGSGLGGALLHSGPINAAAAGGTNFSLAGDLPSSAEVTGTLTVQPGQQIRAICDFGGAAFAALHLDDHLVCVQGSNNGTGCTDDINCDGVDNPFPVLTRTKLPYRLYVESNPDFNNYGAKDQDMKQSTFSFYGTSNDTAKNGKRGSIITSGGYATEPVSVSVQVTTDVGYPPAASPVLSDTEQRRRALQQSLLQGWGQYMPMSYLDHVLLPQGARVRIAICQNSSSSSSSSSSSQQPLCLTEARIDWPDKSGLTSTLRPGLHAYDRSISEMHVLVGKSCNVSMWAGGGTQLLLLFKVVSGSDCSGYTLVPQALTTWYRANALSSTASSLIFTSHGAGTTVAHATRASDYQHNYNNNYNYTHDGDNNNNNNYYRFASTPHLAYDLGAENFTLGLNSGEKALSLADINARLLAAYRAEHARYAKYGASAGVKMAVQAAVMWQTIHNPMEQGPYAPVIRGNPWGLDKHTATHDWVSVMFVWDNILGAYMLSLDARALGYSSLIQVVKGKSALGFLSNVNAAANKQAHSQPPLAGKVLLEMYQKYGDTWLVELLFDDLLDWSNWFNATRRLAPLDIICLGSAEGDMQDARYESGLDNSPMYDVTGHCSSPNGSCGAWNCSQNKCMSFAHNQMQLYDVGMASMHTMDAKALAKLARIINRTAAAEMLEARAAGMEALIESHLWHDEAGIYVNKMPDNRWNYRVAPTSFYPLLYADSSSTTTTTTARVDRMMREWMLNSSRFCISPEGNFAGNSDACYWGLPSIEASDPAFPALGYWRGYVWGPMTQITYWGLQNYDHVPSARQARKALASQMTKLMMKNWNNAGLICENYYPARQHEGCSPGAMHFYHWGALNGFVSLLEGGFY